MAPPRTSPPDEPDAALLRQREDEVLLRRVAERDEAALAELYQRYARPLYSFSLKMLGDAQDAEEVLNDTFVRVWKHAPNYRAERASAFTWLVMIARNFSLDRLRARKANPLRTTQHAELSPNLAPPDDRAESDGVFQREIGHIIGERLLLLPEDQRTCVELAFLRGFSQAEIARHLREPLGTVKARIRRGLLKLRQLLPPV